jgi:hypothetical protein
MFVPSEVRYMVLEEENGFEIVTTVGPGMTLEDALKLKARLEFEHNAERDAKQRPTN